MYQRKYDLFLSYNPLDGAVVKSLASELNSAGISVWFDRWNLVPGQPWASLIEEALTESGAIGICLGSRGNERWPEKDLGIALSIQQQDPSFKIIPILLPDAKESDIPAVIKRISFLDFRRGFDNAEAINRLKSAINKSSESLPIGFSRRSSILSLHPLIPRPPVVGFVSRRDSEGRDFVERLKDELSPDRRKVIVLWGAGGVGKTTLAAEGARALSADFASRIIWIGALGREDFAFPTLLDEIATQLGRADLRALAVETKEEQVRDELSLNSAFLILDNFETIEPNEQRRCLDWLSKPALCSGLIVSRQKVEGLPYIPVEAMSPFEAQLFLRLLLEQISSTSLFAGLDQRLLDLSGRNPLVLQWVLAQIDLAQDPNDVLEELTQGAGDAAKRVFDRSFWLPQVGENGRASLLALALFAPDASPPALAEVAGFGENVKRLNVAIRRLASLWFVKTTSEAQRVMIVEGLTRDLVKAQLMKDERRDDFRQRFIKYFLNYAEAHAQQTPQDYEALEMEKDNLLTAMDVAFSLEAWIDVMRIHGTVERFLDLRGYWYEAVRYGEQAVKAARAANDEKAVIRFLVTLASIRQARGEYDEAQGMYEQALIQYKHVGDDAGVAVIMNNLGLIAQERGDLKEAKRLQMESLEIANKLGDEFGIARGLHNLAWVEQSEGNFAEARRLYRQSLEKKKAFSDQGGSARIINNLGLIEQTEGNLFAAKELYSESLQIRMKLGDQSGIGQSLHNLGSVAQGQGNFAEARRLYSESLDIRTRLGDQRGIALTLGELGALAENEGNRAQAARLFREALSIFEKLGSPFAEMTRDALKKVESTSS